MCRSYIAATLGVLLLAGCATRGPKPRAARKAPAPPSVEGVLARVGDAAEARLAPRFARARVPYPPRRVWLLAFKEELKLELWAQGSGPPTFIRSYAILGASGKAGPKLREGDFQVPEGIYRVLWLNPASRYHLSLRLDYPNAFDRAMARAEGREELGGDIFLHGSDVSEGCIAVGNAAVEELFVLAARVGAEDVRVVIAPNDLRRKRPPTDLKYQPSWLPQLYATIRSELARFPGP